MQTTRSQKQLTCPTPSHVKKASLPAYTSLLLLLILLTAAFVSSLWSVLSTTNTKPTAASTIVNKSSVANVSAKHSKSGKRLKETLLNCSKGNETRCSSYPTRRLFEMEEIGRCPEYFRWIHEDLRAWKERGISREMVERAKETAHFRLVVKKGKAYVERYKKSIQTRDVFTMWGILQLLRRYPGRLPDLELVFDCDDLPLIPPSGSPPPLFRYCGHRSTQDIFCVDYIYNEQANCYFRAEINIRPWEHLLKEIEKGNRRIKWKDREAYAYWKGNPFVAETRQDLLKCNVSTTQDWNARLFVQDWIQESQQGFNQSNLASQCTHRYNLA
ncbi:hypothetical protein CR513_31178, partial [Mucuna pruriens]